MTSKRWNGWKQSLLFIGPVFLIYTLFFIAPFLQGIVYAFTDWNGVDPRLNFIGLRNFVEMFTRDEYFIPSLNRTFFIAVINVFFTNLLAMLFALALTNSFRLNNVWRTSLFLPNVISMVVSGFIWKFMFTQIAKSLAESTGLTVLNQPWLSAPGIVAFSIIIVSLWWGLGYIMTIYIAGIKGIDQSIIEAGEIDGCNAWQSFFHIKLPAMLPVVSVGVFLNVSGSLKIFDVIYSLTGGGPGKSSEVVMLNLYREAFVYGRFGYGTAKALILTLIIVAITYLQLRMSRAEEEN